MTSAAQQLPREWFPISDLVGLPDLPSSQRGLLKKAEREAWLSRPRYAQGGGREYHISSLPAATQAELGRQAIKHQHVLLETVGRNTTFKPARRAKASRQKANSSARAAFDALPDTHPNKQRALAREWFCRSALAYHAASGNSSALASRKEYARLVSAGTEPVPADILQWLPGGKLQESTLRTWLRQYQQGGVAALLPEYGNRKGDTIVARNPDLASMVIGSMLEYPHIQPVRIIEYLSTTDLADKLPSLTALRTFMQQWRDENAQLWARLTNPGHWKNRFQVAHGSHTERVHRLNQVWELDSTPGDWMLTDGRHSVVGCIDLYSRRVQLLVSKTSTANAVCQVMRRGLVAWGVPEIVRTDNGADYVSQQLRGVLDDLEITQELCLPFASEQKGTIERFFRTMSGGLLELLPGFVGHNVAERKVIEERKSFADRIMSGEAVEVSMSAAELQAVLDRWVEAYHASTHRGLSNRTPVEAARSWVGPIRKVDDERALDQLLAPVAGMRTITKKGIQFEHNGYIAPELGLYVGDNCTLKRDEQDIGRLYVYIDGEFICVAECPELRGISRKELAAAARATQQRFLKQQSEELRRHKKAISKNIPEVVLSHRIDQAENVVPLPHRSVEHMTSGLHEAGRAAAVDTPTASTFSPERQAELRALAVRALQQEPANSTAAEETDQARFQRWLAIDAKVKAGESVSDDDAFWHERFQTTTKFKLAWRAYEEGKEICQPGSGN